MRLNISIIAPWLHGKPISSWLFNYYWMPHGCIQGKGDFGVRFVGLDIQLTFDAKWSGISFSVNL